jgi:MFS family permease
MMPASMALLGQAYPDPRARARAVGLWAMGGAIASSSGPVLGGVLTLASWRLIFFINAPVGTAALLLLRRVAPSVRRPVPFDLTGQVAAVTAWALSPTAPSKPEPQDSLRRAFSSRSRSPLPPQRRSWWHKCVSRIRWFPSSCSDPATSVSVAVRFAFVVGYYGLPFVMSLYLQQLRGLSAFNTGCVFLPMMITAAALTPSSARIAERFGARTVITTGLVVMAAGLLVIAAAPASAPVWALALLMILVGLAGPLTIPPVTAVLLNSVPDHQAGTASGVFNTSRQIGGALAIAVFGALVAGQGGLVHGLRISLLLAAVVALAAAASSRMMRPVNGSDGEAFIGAITA